MKSIAYAKNGNPRPNLSDLFTSEKPTASKPPLSLNLMVLFVKNVMNNKKTITFEELFETEKMQIAYEEFGEEIDERVKHLKFYDDTLEDPIIKKTLKENHVRKIFTLEMVIAVMDHYAKIELKKKK